MKLKKPFICLVASLSLLSSINSLCFADNTEEVIASGCVITRNDTSAQLDELALYCENLTRDVGESYVEWGTPVTKSVSGYPGNQPANGTYFSAAGGSFSYSSDSGPSSSVSVNLGDPYGIISISYTLGQISSGSVSYNFSIPSNQLPGYFKLYIYKTYTVKPYTVYYRTGPGAVWEVSLRSHITSLQSINHSILKIS